MPTREQTFFSQKGTATGRPPCRCDTERGGIVAGEAGRCKGYFSGAAGRGPKPFGMLSVTEGNVVKPAVGALGASCDVGTMTFCGGNDGAGMSDTLGIADGGDTAIGVVGVNSVVCVWVGAIG